MRALLDLFLDICLFRKAPQDVPSSRALLRLCLLAYAGSGLLVLLIGAPAQVALLQMLLDLALLSGLLYLGLSARRHANRFEQTLSALTGSGSLLGLLALPLLFWLSGQPRGDAAALPSMLLLLLMVWSIAVMAHILRHAFEIPIWLGAVLALAYTYLSWTLTGWIDPRPPLN